MPDNHQTATPQLVNHLKLRESGEEMATIVNHPSQVTKCVTGSTKALVLTFLHIHWICMCVIIASEQCKDSANIPSYFAKGKAQKHKMGLGMSEAGHPPQAGPNWILQLGYCHRIFLKRTQNNR